MGHMKGNDTMRVTSWSYYVGQGTANLIQLAYSEGVINILIDCGSMGKAEKLPKSTAVDKILARTGKKLDYLIISHTDLDHINLIQRLLEGGLTITEQVIIGGTVRGVTALSDVFSKANQKKVTSVFKKLLETLAWQGICGEDKIDFTSTADYANAVVRYEENGEQFAIRLLACRSCMSVKKDTALINSNSVVAVCEYTNSSGQTANICYGGDATVETFDYMNEKMNQAERSGDRTYEKLLHNSSNVLIAPHHAALKTACSREIISAGTTLDGQMYSAKEFSHKINACCVFASAYYRAYHWHPCYDIFDIYAQNVSQQNSEHNCAGFQMILEKDGKPRIDYLRDYKCTSTTKNKYTSFAFAKTFKEKNLIRGGRKGVSDYSYLDAKRPEEKLYDFVCELCEEKLLTFTLQEA